MSLPPPDFPVSEDQGPKPTSGLAITSLVSSLLWCCGLGSLLAVIFGHSSMGAIRRGERTGHGLAVAGLVLGYLGLVGTVVGCISMAARWPEIQTLFKVEMFEEMVKEYRRKNGELPASLDALGDAVSDVISPVDSWGKPLRLVKEDAHWYVVSSGPDGRDGTSDDVRSDHQ